MANYFQYERIRPIYIHDLVDNKSEYVFSNAMFRFSTTNVRILDHKIQPLRRSASNLCSTMQVSIEGWKLPCTWWLKQERTRTRTNILIWELNNIRRENINLYIATDMEKLSSSLARKVCCCLVIILAEYNIKWKTWLLLTMILVLKEIKEVILV